MLSEREACGGKAVGVKAGAQRETGKRQNKSLSLNLARLANTHVVAGVAAARLALRMPET